MENHKNPFANSKICFKNLDGGKTYYAEGRTNTTPYVFASIEDSP